MKKAKKRHTTLLPLLIGFVAAIGYVGNAITTNAAKVWWAIAGLVFVVSLYVETAR